MTEQHLEELIQKYADSSASDEEIRELMDWYRKAPVADVPWQSSNAKEKEDLYHRMLQKLHRETRPGKIRMLHYSWLKVAAILLLIAGATFLAVHFSNSPSESYITVSNSFGKIQSVQLPDNSIVWLNAASTLRYAKDFNKYRELQLEGEAFFDVTHDAKHPFRVKTGGVKTTVLGTSFNIEAYSEDRQATISVITGRVRVNNDAKELAVLTPAGQLRYDKQNRVATTSSVDTMSVVAWKKGKLQFEGEAFAAIAKSLERWYGIKIKFVNPGLRNCRYYMSFDNDTPLEKLLAGMAELTEMQYAIDQNNSTVTLSGKECK